jgi:Family of unknown function (DUF5677)
VASPSAIAILAMADNPDLGPVGRMVERFVARAHEELEDRLAHWPTDLARQQVHEVVGALLARQVTLASELASSPGIWDAHVAPLLLRAMADAYITLAWIMKEPVDRSRMFILYGLGQAKLQLEHRKAELASRVSEPGEQEFIKALEEWINRQRFTFLTDVNLGSWSGISTRQMAEQAGCLDFYNYVYTPFSGCAHSTWQHVAIHNLTECQNPLHRFHSVPAVPELSPDPHYLYLGAKYLQKTFVAFDLAFAITSALKSSLDVLCEDLGAFDPPASAVSEITDERSALTQTEDEL